MIKNYICSQFKEIAQDIIKTSRVIREEEEEKKKRTR
jgi:hypothetical protein